MKQGLLGDCWLLVACAALQKSRHLLDQVSVAGRAALLLCLPVCCAQEGSRRQGSGTSSLWALLWPPGTAGGNGELCSRATGAPRRGHRVRLSPRRQRRCFLLCSALLSPGFSCRQSCVFAMPR